MGDFALNDFLGHAVHGGGDILAVPPGHRLALKRRVSVADLEGERFMMR